MINKIIIIIWFILRPSFYPHFFSLIKRKFLFNHDTELNRINAFRWAKDKSVSYPEALQKLDFKGDIVGLDSDTINEAKKLKEKSLTRMGGSGHIHLLYDCVKLLKAKIVLETGVAYGWSSLSILKALFELKNGKLLSIDMPYPGKKNENDVGIVVPNYLKKNWILIRKPDNPGIIEALSLAGGKIDLCHYDSDKSWWGRDFAYPILWNAIKPNGLFISDDIQDNLYFSNFVEKNSLKFTVVEFEGKFVGMIRKN
tara:strand:- start:226 stop:990 length:765 start_codon:yes stop_codon:yes gene_type:complete